MSNPVLEIVSHCWRYSRVLAYHLMSLDDYPPTIDTVVTVWYTDADRPTADVLRYFARALPLRGVRLRRRNTTLCKLLNRNIGRNTTALETRADYVWFCDADYCFGPGCLDAIPKQFPADSVLCYPSRVRRHVSLEDGDAFAASALFPVDAELPLSLFRDASCEWQAPKKSIGGLQIVRGDTAREYGYCRESSNMQKPTTDEKWRPTTGDVRYRKSLGAGNGTPIDLPNLFRIRQSVAGEVDTREG